MSICYYRLRFKKANRWLVHSDCNPLDDSDNGEVVVSFKINQDARDALQKINDFYKQMGLDAPEIEIVGFTPDGDVRNKC